MIDELRLKEICNMVYLSNICVIGYTTFGERTKDQLISMLSTTEIIDFDNIDSYIRERKINQIINIDTTTRLLIDMSNIPRNSTEPFGGVGGRIKFLRRLYNQLKNEKVVFTSKMFHHSMEVSGYSHSIPSEQIYNSDLVIEIDRGIKIAKSRYSTCIKD